MQFAIPQTRFTRRIEFFVKRSTGSERGFYALVKVSDATLYAYAVAIFTIPTGFTAFAGQPVA